MKGKAVQIPCTKLIHSKFTLSDDVGGISYGIITRGLEFFQNRVDYDIPEKWSCGAAISLCNTNVKEDG